MQSSSSITEAKTFDIKFVPDGDPLNQFRMKLPDSKYVAFLAVGVNEKGENFAHTLAMREMDEALSLTNLVEATKKILGTSYGVLLRHKRIMDGHSEKFSDEAMEAARQELLTMKPDQRRSKLSSRHGHKMKF